MKNMKESYPTRRETAAEQIEQSPRYEALQTLAETGVLKKLSDLELYHGRAGDGKPWRVLPDFDNSGNKTGNMNINKKPALNTGTKEVATEFANARSFWDGGTAEVHRIVSRDPDAAIIDAEIKLSREDEQRVADVMLATMPGSPLRWVPLRYEDRHALDNVDMKDFISNGAAMYDTDIKRISEKTGLREDLVLRIGSAINTRIVLTNPGGLQKLARLYGENNNIVCHVDSKNVKHNIPISHEFMANWFRENHIVGCKENVRSGTLQGKLIDNYLLYDLEKINAQPVLEKARDYRAKRLGKMSMAAMKSVEKIKNAPQSWLREMLVDPYSSPRDLIDAAKQTKGFKELFEMDDGNWEHYTIEQHTETVLTIFENNYADVLPASVLPFIRTALLVHDIGKGVAAANHDKANQDKYNYVYARKFMQDNGIDNATARFITAITGDVKELVLKATLEGDKQAGSESIDRCKEILKDYLGDENTNDEIAFGLLSLIQVLQTCDSAAYSSMAYTRSKTNSYYRNYGTFNNSFNPFHGLTGNRARFAKHVLL